MSTAKFSVLEAGLPKDYSAWLNLWNLWPQREVFAHPGYVGLYADSKTKAQCAILESDKGYVLYPFLKRDLRAEEFCTVNTTPLADIITPYGYGGAFAWRDDDREALSGEFWELFNEYARSNNIISEVIKLSLFEDTMLEYPGTKEEKLQNIVVNLSDSASKLWSGFKHKVRKNVKKAIESGVTIITDDTGKYLDEFMGIYANTMDRRNAQAKYYFSRTFFEQIQATLAGHYIYFYATYKDKIVSCELVLISEDKVYSFLGGTDSNAFSVRPNDLLKYNIILWAKGQDKKKYVLGGGYLPNDGIYNYKRSFYPDGSLPFFVGWRILNHELYDSVIQARSLYSRDNNIPWLPQKGNVPEYRT